MRGGIVLHRINKRLLTAILVAAMLLSLAACGKGDTTGSGSLGSVLPENVTEELTSGTERAPDYTAASTTGTTKRATTTATTTAQFTEPEESTPAPLTNIAVVKRYEVTALTWEPNFRRENFQDPVSGNSMPYRLYVPAGYNAQKRYPVILFLHGAGEVGRDNQSHLPHFTQCFDVASDIVGEAIIVCPQTPAGWSMDMIEGGDQKGYLGIAKRILDSVIACYNGDPDRIYLTGLSMGSFATWRMLDTFPGFFAAAVPVCGGGDSYASSALVNTPIWIYHGTADDTVHISSSEATYSAIIAAGGRMVQFTRLPGVGHDAWNYAYNDREMFSWMFSQNRRTHQSNTYTYRHRLELLTADGRMLFNEEDLSSVGSYTEDGVRYMELQLNTDAHARLKAAYRQNADALYTFTIFDQKLYDFRFTASPDTPFIPMCQTTSLNDYMAIFSYCQAAING